MFTTPCKAVFAQFFLTDVFNIPPAVVGDARAILFIFAVMIVIELPGLAVSAIVEGLQRYDLLALLDVSRLVVFAGSAWATFHTGSGLIALAAGLFASTVVYAIAAVVVAKRLVPGIRVVLGGDKETLHELYRLTQGLFILRAKRPDIDRPYRAFGYPLLPALYIVLCCGVMVLLLLSPATRTEAVSGLVLVLIGIPVFYLWRRVERPAIAGA